MEVPFCLLFRFFKTRKENKNWGPTITNRPTNKILLQCLKIPKSVSFSKNWVQDTEFGTFFQKRHLAIFFVKHKDFGHLFIPQKSILFTLLFLRFSIENKRSASKMTQSYLDHEKMANLSRVFLPNCIFTVKSQKKRGRPGWQKVLRKLGNIFLLLKKQTQMFSTKNCVLYALYLEFKIWIVYRCCSP